MAEEKAPKQFSYGGQAVIEGVMMRGAHKAAIAVRDPQGNIVVHEQPLNAALYRGKISKTPFVRGIVGLWDALNLGTRALLWSADVALGEEDVSFNGPIGYATLAFSLILSVGLFFILPTAAASGLERLLGLEHSSFIVNLLEGVVRLGLVVGYIWLIGRLEDVKRLFGYHGAEHKTINAYEAGAELTPEVVQNYPIEHPRCGTAFLLTVVFVSVLSIAAGFTAAIWSSSAASWPSVLDSRPSGIRIRSTAPAAMSSDQVKGSKVAISTMAVDAAPAPSPRDWATRRAL